MNEAPPQQPLEPHPPEQERLAFGWVTAVGIAAVVIFAGAVVWADTILREETRVLYPPGKEPPPASQVGAPEIGIVDQEMFELGSRGESDRQEQLQRLGSYGWVDRDAGVLHIPITRAMDEVVRELSRGGTPP